jgi:hypothetical protein
VQLYRFLTVPVDEFMTTKMYNGDKAVQRRDTGATDSSCKGRLEPETESAEPEGGESEPERES